MHSKCIRIAVKLHSCLTLHSLQSNCSRTALSLLWFCTFFQHWIICAFFVSRSLNSFSICFTIIYNFPRPIIYCTLFALFLQYLLHSNCTRIALCSHSLCTLFQHCIICVFSVALSLNVFSICFTRSFHFPQGHYLLHYFCIIYCTRLAFELHSNCTRVVLCLHSCCTLWSIPPAPLLIALFVNYLAHVCSLFGQFPQGQHVLRYVCTLFAIVLHSLITLDYLCIRIDYEMHSNCVELHSFLTLHSNCNRIAFEFHSNCILLKRCTFCCTRCCIVFAIVLHCVCTLWSIPPESLFLHSLLDSNCTLW